MNDSARLYFIALLDEALESADPSKALREAATKIYATGKLPEYKEGFAQFQTFLETIIKSRRESSPLHERSARRAAYQILSELVADPFACNETKREALIESVQNDPAWRAEFNLIRTELQDALSQPPVQIEVLRDDELIASFSIPEMPVNIRNASPGDYVVRLSTGRVLWEGELLKKHLLWLDACGDKNLPMAAATEDAKPKTTLSESLMGGELIWDVIPDLRSGELRFSHGTGKR